MRRAAAPAVRSPIASWSRSSRTLAGARVKDGRKLIDAVWALDKADDASKILAMTVPA